ncbi:MAG: hypothetical protein IJW00_11155, partial [Clostridia bacterium]|nr:hypothetical protein [Clostridia bacterium]
MYGMILLGAVILICAICAGFSALRGFSKSLVRVLTVLLSAVAAVVTCFALKSSLPTPEEFLILVENNLGIIAQNFGGDTVAMVEEVMGYASISPTLIEFAIQLVGALLVPLLCLVFFLLYCLVTWIVYLIVTLILRRPMKAFNKKMPVSRLWAACLGLAQGLIIVGILFVPVSGYLQVADTAVTAMVEQNVLEKDDPTIQTVQTIVDELDNAPVLSVYRVLGGDLTTSSLMKMDVADMDVYLDEEVDSIMVLAGHIMNLTKTEMSAYGEKEAAILRAIGDSFDDSKLITPIACDILYAATEAWMNGEAFLTIEKPSMGESDEIFAPFLDALLEIIHDDCEIDQLLQGDVKTIAEMAAILSTHGVFAKIENPDELLTVLSGGEVIKPLVTELGKNRTMKLLIPEMTNLGVRAIGQVLSIPKNTEAVYDSFMNEVAGALNELDQSADAQQIADLSKRLDTAFDEAGIVI